MDDNTIPNIPDFEEDVIARRNEHVQNFKIEFSVDDIPDVEEVPLPIADPSTAEEESQEADEAKQTISREETPKKAAKNQNSNGCLKRMVFGLIILIISGALSYFAVIFLLDSLAINRSNKSVDFLIEPGDNTVDIAQQLVEKGVIDQPLCFRIFSKITGADGKYQIGAFTLTQDMGYSTIVEQLQTMTPRETVKVTIPEGYTVEEIAKLLEDAEVCEANSFYEAVISGSFDYDFVNAIPTAVDGEKYKGRIYRLEGYLFPDTYEFYIGSSGETVVATMLENFDKKLTSDIREQITKRGWTIDQAVIMASLIEGEAAKTDDMEKVSRVLANRLEPDSGFSKLQLCSTRDYVKDIVPSIGGIEVTSVAYNTYLREGLPVGAINNPGLRALKAALNPSSDEEIMKCYFFATDYKTEITYFSKTFKEHQYICDKYDIEDLG